MRLGALRANEEFTLNGIEYVAGHADGYGCAWVISREDGKRRIMSLDTEVNRKEKANEKH